MNFFAELKRRNVYKVAVAYAVVAWLLIQAASIFLPAFDAPPWVMKIFIIVVIFGFPVALVLSWAFEITPEGIKLESEVAPNEAITRRTGRKIVGITVVLAVIAAGLLAFNLFRTKPVTPPTTATPITNKSVAVLAFANLSDDKGSEYFSDGISEELLTVLQKIPGLHVAARTSAFSFLEGKFEEAAVEAQDDAAEWARLLVVAMARWSQKRIPEADAALARLTEGFADIAAYLIAEVYAYRGDKDRAFEWLERARRQRDGGLGFMLCDPFLANLHGDPRWIAFLHTVGLADGQLK